MKLITTEKDLIHNMPFRYTLTNLKTLDFEVLNNDPVGWDDATFMLTRHNVYKGMASEFITSLKFHCKGGGKEFVDAVYNSDFIDGRIDILIEYDCDGSGTYDSLYRGIVNLASYTLENDYTVCTIEQSDLTTKMFKRDEISIDVGSDKSIGGQTITPAVTNTLPMPSTEIYYENEWRIPDDYWYNHTQHVASGGYEVWITQSLNVLKSDIDTVYPSVESYDDSADQDGYIGAFERSMFTDPILTAQQTGVTYPLTMELDFRFKGTYTDDETTTGGGRENEALQFKIIKGRIDINDTDSIDDVYAFNIGTYIVDNFSVDFDVYGTFTFTLESGESVWAVWQYTNAGSGAYTVSQTWEYEIGYIKLNTRTTYKDTTTKAVLVHEALNQVVDSIADSDGNFRSDFYGRTDSQKLAYDADGCGGLLALTNGLNIRLFQNKPLVFNFKELFKSLDSIHNIGMAVVGSEVRIEPLNFWFNPTALIISLPFVNSFRMKVDESRVFNKASIGYDKWETEFKGGLDEPCTKHEYATIVSSAKGFLNKLSTYISSTYAIELTRRKNIDILPTEDWRYDNDVFFIALKRLAYIDFTPELFSDAFSSGQNMQVLTTAYNLRLTPKRMLLAHINVITAGLQKIQGLISFVKGEGNTDLETTKIDIGCQEDFDGQSLAENQDIDWTDDRAANIRPLWFPEIYIFEYPLTYQQFKTIKANPYGYIEFYRFEDTKMAGYILNMEYSLKTGMTKFELLRIYAPEGLGDEFGNYIGDEVNAIIGGGKFQ